MINFIRARLTVFIPLVPVVLLTCAALFGGIWIYAALLYTSVFAFVMDEIDILSLQPADSVWSERLPVILAFSQFLLLPLAVYALAVGSSGLVDKILMFFAFTTFFGFVGTSTAHELIHKGKRSFHMLGRTMFITLLYGHHTSAHVHIHHRYVATKDDPNSAPLGQSIYRYLPKAWLHSFVKGYRAEQSRLAHVDHTHINPYFYYINGALLCLGLAWAIGGGLGVLVYILLAGHAQMQLLMTDYVQHYGLHRTQLSDGTYEPVGPEHSWNAPHWFTGALTLQAPRHSHHHTKPLTPYSELEAVDETTPQLPHSLPVMAALALSPRYWRKIMDPRVAKWTS